MKDTLDLKAISSFEGHVVRKDLARRHFPHHQVPLVEHLLCKYCPNHGENEEIEFVNKHLRNYAVTQEELTKHIKEHGFAKTIGIIHARFDTKRNRYIAELPKLALSNIRISNKLVDTHKQMLSDSIYAELTISRTENQTLSIESVKPVHPHEQTLLDVLFNGRAEFTSQEWIDFLLRSVGLEPTNLTNRAKHLALLRMVPFVETNYNLIELGPHGTGKSYTYSQLSPFSHLITNGRVFTSDLFVNTITGKHGWVCSCNVVGFDNISKIQFEDDINFLKNYMVSGWFSRENHFVVSNAGIVILGDSSQHLFNHLPQRIGNVTAFLDQIHSYIPGWDFPQLKPNEHFTNHFGLSSDFLGICWNLLRSRKRFNVFQERMFWGGALSISDIEAVNKTMNGLLKLVYPNPIMAVSDRDLQWMAQLALEMRRRVKEHQKQLSPNEFRKTSFSFTPKVNGMEQFVPLPEQSNPDLVSSDPLPPGQLWCIGTDLELVRIETTCSSGDGISLLGETLEFHRTVNTALQYLHMYSRELVGDHNFPEYQFSVRLLATRNGRGLGVPVLISLCSALLKRNVRGGTVIVGNDPPPNAIQSVQLALEKQAQSILLPISARSQLTDLPDDIWTKIRIEFYRDAVDAVSKAIGH